MLGACHFVSSDRNRILANLYLHLGLPRLSKVISSTKIQCYLLMDVDELPMPSSLVHTEPQTGPENLNHCTLPNFKHLYQQVHKLFFTPYVPSEPLS